MMKSPPHGIKSFQSLTPKGKIMEELSELLAILEMGIGKATIKHIGIDGIEYNPPKPKEDD